MDPENKKDADKKDMGTLLGIADMLLEENLIGPDEKLRFIDLIRGDESICQRP